MDPLSPLPPLHSIQALKAHLTSRRKPLTSLGFPSALIRVGSVLSVVWGSLAFAPLARGIVQLGSNCDAVFEVQAALVGLGYDTGAVDGVFGEQTVIALQEFQRTNGLPPDGVVGPQTAQALGLQGSVYGIGETCGVADSPSAPDAETLFAYTITSDALNVRSGPGLNFDVVQVIYRGAIVNGSTPQNNWIQLSNGGWIAANHVAFAPDPSIPSNSTAAAGIIPQGSGPSADAANPVVSPEIIEAALATGKIRVMVPALNVRSGPGVDYPVKGILLEGEEMPLSGEATDDGWLQLAWGDWVLGSFIVPVE